MKESHYKYEYRWCTDKDLQRILTQGAREGCELITANREVQPTGVFWHMIWKISLRNASEKEAG